MIPRDAASEEAVNQPTASNVVNIWKKRHRMSPEFIIIPSALLMVAFVIWTTVTAWQRRQRLRLLTDFNNRLIDRLGSVKDFSEFASTEGGIQFLNAVLADAPSLGPRERILRATDIGIVAVALGLGFLFLGWYFEQESRRAFVVLGVIAMSLGLGSLASSFVSYRLTSGPLAQWSGDRPIRNQQL